MSRQRTVSEVFYPQITFSHLFLSRWMQDGLADGKSAYIQYVD